MPQLNSMHKIRYEVALPGRFKRIADATSGHLIFEYKAQIRDMRMFQATVMGLAQILQENPERKAILIIDESRISIPRMTEEWKSYLQIFHPKIHDRLCITAFEEDELTLVLGNLRKEEEQLLEEVRTKLSSEQSLRKRRSADSFLEVFRVMLVQWFRGAGPLQLKELCRLTGFSYPTVASALDKMERYLHRRSDRSAELREFPYEIWRKLLAGNEGIRAPITLTSQKPRPLELLLDNLEGYSVLKVGFGGIIGARHYLPGIDLVGTHRLDLTLKDTREDRIQRLIRRLDPALKPVEINQTPQVVIHRLFRPKTFFQEDPHGNVADEVECLLDLHEARLETQASELLEHLIRRVRS